MHHHNHIILEKSVRYRKIVDLIVSGNAPALLDFAAKEGNVDDVCDNCDACFDALFHYRLITRFSSGEITTDQIKQEIQSWRYSTLNGEANGGLSGLSELVFERTPATVSSPLIYLDQSVLSIALREDDYFSKLMELKEKNGIQFVYSPSHAEEIAKIEKPDDRSCFFDAISRLTGNMSLQPDAGDLSIKPFFENPRVVVARVDKTRKASEAVEKKKTLKDEDRKLYFSRYDTQESRKSLGNARNIFDSMDDDEFSKLMFMSGFSRKSDFKNIRRHDRIRSAIYALHDAMDFMAYKQDKKDRQQKSSIHDIEHLIYASCCEYFATNDSNLRIRAEEIYRFLGLPILVLGKDDIFSISIPTASAENSSL